MWLITILCGLIAGAVIGNYAFQSLSKSRSYRLFVGACLGCSLVIISMMFIASSLTTHWQHVQTIELQERISPWDIKYHIVYTSYGDDIFYDFVDDETGEEYRISVVDNIVAV